MNSHRAVQISIRMSWADPWGWLRLCLTIGLGLSNLIHAPAVDLDGIERIPWTPAQDRQPSIPVRVDVVFPTPFDHLPALRVLANGATEPARILSMTTNGFAAAIRLIPDSVLSRSAAEADWFDRLSENTSLGWVDGRPALVAVESTESGDQFVQVHIAGSEPGSWQTTLVRPVSATGQNLLCATLFEGRLAVLSECPEGLCVGIASGPQGEQPWTTETLTPITFSIGPTFMAEACGKLFVGLAVELPNEGAQRVVVWRRDRSGENVTWFSSSPTQLWPIRRPGLSSIRLGEYDHRALLITENRSISFFGLRDPVWSYSTTCSAYLCKEEPGSPFWEEVDSNELGLTPRQQWTRYRERAAVLTRGPVELGKWNSVSKPPRAWQPDPPRLLVPPKEIHWTATSEAKLVGLQHKGADLELFGYGVVDKTYRMLRSLSLTNNASDSWEFTVPDTGEFRFSVSNEEATGFFRLE